MKKTLPLFLCLLALVVGPGYSQDTKASELLGQPLLLSEGLFFEIGQYDDTWVTTDASGDSRVDYAMLVDDESLMRNFEAIDSNNDGKMDDFYIYSNDVLIRREIDQDFNGVIDLVVFISQGVYVEKYYRDQSGDGLIDQVRVFGEQ
ncbi:hypothetical protein [Spirochaeta lutea]|uniref:EF-hand domain-containing protein n=1 Tax=Spirochaeta lutea TaxID=1480694 RepID=A0A098R283_9SPIO|nr:hypothetical protein [Spirochaeta lutea]KGE73773.1 hypothetical protein DC28_00675 [Spirochaeta lutea]